MPDRFAALAYDIWLTLDAQRSRDARRMSPDLRRLHDELGAALREGLTDDERAALLAAPYKPLKELIHA